MDMMHELKTILTVIAVSGGLLLQIFPSPASASVYCVPVLAVMLDTSDLHARLSGGVATSVQFTGQMYVSKLPVERCVVTLKASTDNGWAARVSPTTAVFTCTTPQNFSCAVVVPAGTLWNQSCNLTIAGRAVGGGLQMDAVAKGIIKVEPWFRIVLQTPRPIATITQGKQAFFTVFAGNLGNSIDSFEIEIANIDELKSAGWAAAIGGGTLPKVEPGGYRPVRLTVQSPSDDWSIDNKLVDLKFNVTSRNARDLRQAVSEAITLTIHVRSVWLPSLSPYLLILALSVAAGYLLRPRSRPDGRASR